MNKEACRKKILVYLCFFLKDKIRGYFTRSLLNVRKEDCIRETKEEFVKGFSFSKGVLLLEEAENQSKLIDLK